MKNILTLSLHSFVDVITNSSSELFVCGGDKTLQVVKSILQSLLSDYNEKNECAYDFDGVFKEPYIISDLNVHDFVSTIEGYGMMLPNGLQFPETVYEYCDSRDMKVVEEFWKKQEEKRNKITNDWLKINQEAIHGLIVIQSAGDNTIPYELMEAIELALNATSTHLG